MLESGGFHLTKWICNNHEVLDVIPQSEMASQLRNLSLDIEALPIERALGLEWNVEGDCFQFNISQKDKPRTRRGILSMVFSIFDPLGFVAPFVLSTKVILQRLCKKVLGWDEIIPEEDLFEWQKWLAELPKLERFKVNRCFHPPEFGDITKSQLHHFSDASELGYGAVSYLRSVNSHGNINCSFVMGKSRLAPVKPRTIPRLELSAATTAVRSDTMIKQEVDVALDTSILGLIVLLCSRMRVMRRNNSEHLLQTEFLSSVMPQNPTNGTMSVLNVTQQMMLPEVKVQMLFWKVIDG